MTEDSSDERSTIAMALEWSTRVTTIGLEMVLPVAAGYWIDRRVGTMPLFVIVGAVSRFRRGHVSAMANCTTARPKDQIDRAGPVPQKSLLLRELILLVVVIAAGAIIIPVGWMIFPSPMGLLAGASAAGVCFLAAASALGACEPLRNPRHLLALVSVGMALRFGIPMAAVFAVFFLLRPLANAGFLYYLIVFYPITLAVETALILPQGRSKG